MTTSLTGQIHLMASCLALISGTYILFAIKGPLLHKRVGYIYVGVIMSTTAIVWVRNKKIWQNQFHSNKKISLFSL